MAEILLNNRYQLLEPLGHGGMAVVYRARDLMLERPVAIKVLRENYSSDPSFQDQFRLEAKSVANLSHPNIVTVHDFGYDQGMLFLVMEQVPGTNLKAIMEQVGRFTPEAAIPLLVQACAGIGYAHRAGLVHCDVKPHNMLVTPDQRVKVADFGIARALSRIKPGERSNVVWGSPMYFSPEQSRGYAPSPASDVYSLGVVLYEMLTGQPPFTGRTAEALSQQHRETAPLPPSEFVPDIPPALEQIILKVLSKEPSARYRTADQLGRVLTTFGKLERTPTLQLTPPIPPEAPAPRQPLARPETSSPPTQPTRQSSIVPEDPHEEPPDLVSALLGLGALIAWGGLLPAWAYVWYLFNPIK